MTTDMEIDETLYSRQMYVYGKSMAEICNANVLMYGLSGLGVEVAKNLILSGIKSLDIIHENTKVNSNVYGSNIYTSEEDVGKKMFDVVIPKLKELNPYVTVNIIDDLVDYSKYDAVVCLDIGFEELKQINNETHKLNVPFVSAMTYGLTGNVFNDFGEEFVVNDPTGENIKEASISNAYIDMNAAKTDISMYIETLDTHDLSQGEMITLHNTQTNESQGPFKVLNISRSKDNITNIIEIECNNKTDTFDPNMFVSYGELKEVRQPITMKFKPLEEALKQPTHSYIFYEHMNRQDMLHVIYQMANIFERVYNRFPIAYNEYDFNLFMKQFDKIKTDVQLDEKLVKMFINHCGLVPAVISVIGALASQEVLKAITQKYTPINQFVYFESFDSLPDDEHRVYLSNTISYRYGQMVNVFGYDFMEKLMNMKMFMVGCGAIGCELLKNFAMMGVACGENGLLTITDPDTIEKSNLNRQFLFRMRHIGDFKSSAASDSILKMNPNMKIIARMDKIGPESEEIYNTPFYRSLDIVANALDNINARTYVDSKCVENGIPLLESGTLGVKGNVQVVVPNKSESYSSSSDPPEKDIPVCTLKNFPSQIEHTSQWALAIFKGLFTDAPNNINKYLETPEFVIDLEFDELENVYKDITRYGIKDVPKSSAYSVIVAIKQFNYYFNDMILELLKQFPSDSTTSSGLPFWGGNKRCPKPIPFDCNNNEHIEFVKHFVYLYNRMYNISDDFIVTKESVENVIKMNGPIESYKITEKFAANDEEEKANKEKKKENTDERGDMIKQLNPEIMKLNVNGMIPDKFEKDDDSNHHIDFISIVANTRAMNYEIKTAERHKIKGIVGRIIPAIATTTALVAGLVSLELCKFIAGHTDLTKFRNAFINLGLSFMAFSDPTVAKVYKLGDKEFTMWNHLDISDDMTLNEFRQKIEAFYGVGVDSISYGRKLIYNSCIPAHANSERNNLMMSDLLEKLEIEIITGNCLTMNIMLDTEEEFEEPDVRYWLR